MSAFADHMLTCRDCGIAFRWTARGQADFEALGFAPPKRCQDCRRRRARENEAAGERIVGAFDAHKHRHKR